MKSIGNILHKQRHFPSGVNLGTGHPGGNAFHGREIQSRHHFQEKPSGSPLPLRCLLCRKWWLSATRRQREFHFRSQLRKYCYQVVPIKGAVFWALCFFAYPLTLIGPQRLVARFHAHWMTGHPWHLWTSFCYTQKGVPIPRLPVMHMYTVINMQIF